LGLDRTQESATIENCKFIGNFSTTGGGAIWMSTINGGSGTFSITKCLFFRNKATTGGAVYINGTVEGDGLSSITYCKFYENKAANRGGAVFDDDYFCGRFEYCYFSSNVANEGGAIHSEGGRVQNCIFQKNKALAYGGAIRITLDFGESGHGLDIYHTNFISNESLYAGGAIDVQQNNVSILNSILRDNISHANTARHILATLTDNEHYLDISHSNIDLEEGFKRPDVYCTPADQLRNQGGNIDVDPSFAFEDNFHLMPDSPCIDAGENLGMETKPDMDGYGVADGNGDNVSAPDIGAYEFVPFQFPVPAVSRTMLVFTARKDVFPDFINLKLRNRGLEGTPDWVISEEISWLSSVNGSTIPGSAPTNIKLMADPNQSGISHGVYTGTVNLSNREGSMNFSTLEIIFYVTETLEVDSAYDTIQAAIDAAIDGDDVIVADIGQPYSDEGNTNIDFLGKSITVKSKMGPELTVIDCNNSGRGFHFHTRESNSSVLDGFTIRNCAVPDWGGGVLVEKNCSPTIVNCIFEDNAAGTTGGGMHVETSETVVRNCRFIENSAPEGGGIYIEGSFDEVIDECEFIGNEATSGNGGGVNIDAGGYVTISRSQFSGNSGRDGGAVYKDGSMALINISACTFSENDTGDLSGILHFEGVGGIILSTVLISNCIFDNNDNAGSSEYALWIKSDRSNIKIHNSNFINNGGGLYFTDGPGGAGILEINNSIFSENNTAGMDLYVDPYAVALTKRISHCFISDATNWNENDYPNDHISNSDPLFTGDYDEPYRLQINSSCIDAGVTIPSLYSDIRGSIRPVDGPNDGNDEDAIAQFDIGAYEYSDYYGGPPGDLPASVFKHLEINGSLIVTDHEYEISWMDRDPFPFDPRIQQAGRYTVNLLLVNEQGLRLELGNYTVQVSQHGYSIPFTFWPDHIGTWRIRVELESDPNQYILSEVIKIEYKKTTEYFLGKQIYPPEGADPNQKPEIDNEDIVYWSAHSNRLFAVAEDATLITWYADAQRTIPIPVVALIVPPDDPQIHIADSLPVDLLPPDTDFDMVEMKYTSSGAMVSGNEFTANKEGYTVLFFLDNQAPDPFEKEKFEVVRTVGWNDSDLGFPYETEWDIGQEIVDIEPSNNDPCQDGCLSGQSGCHETACGNGYVFFENAYFDGAGEDKAYDRSTREGRLFAVNRDITGPIQNDVTDPQDDLVVVWYNKSSVSNACWPSKPVRYIPKWPDEVPSCDGCTICQEHIDDMGEIVIASELGSGPLDPEKFSTPENMLIYNQVDRALPGFNPNDEHAEFFPASGSEYLAVFALRTDLNRSSNTESPNYDPSKRPTSDPYVLLKYRDPLNEEWNFKVYKVLAENDDYKFLYTGVAGSEINPPYPLDQFTFGPCEESYSSTPDLVLNDKDDKFFAKAGGINGNPIATVVLNYFYRLQTAS
jgi:hypothetical protein